MAVRDLEDLCPAQGKRGERTRRRFTRQDVRDLSPLDTGPFRHEVYKPLRTAIRNGIDQARRSSTKARERCVGYFSRSKGYSKFPSSAVAKQPQSADQPLEEQAHDVVRAVGSRRESTLFAGGALVFGCLLFILGSEARWCLPTLYLLFLACCLPLRAAEFHARKWDFFLIDFCYWANLATAAFLVCCPANQQIGAAVYALADGPLAGALIIWQSAWVFGSLSHCISVLIHLLPGLALFVHRHFPPPDYALDAARRWGLRLETAPADVSIGFLHLFVMPMAFYALWQFVYWLVVQVMFRSFIQWNGYDTSYKTLARRAQRTNNIWNRLVRRGSAARRVSVYGLLQLAFTVICLLAFLPVFHSFYLSLLWQIVKVVVPIYYGAQHQCERLPRSTVTSALRQYKSAVNASSAAPSIAAFSIAVQPAAATAGDATMLHEGAACQGGA